MESEKLKATIKVFLYALKVILLFLKNAWGSLNKPYETYRRLAQGKNSAQVLPLFFFIFLYFAFSLLVHQGMGNPLILTLSFSKLVLGTALTYFLVLFSLLFLGKIFGGQGGWRRIFLPWSYSLLPTLIWFLATSLFYVFLPPPRTTSLPGQAFSFLFIAFSLGVFFWKGILYYLSLRFALRLDFLRITGVSLILFPLGILYSFLMYRLGIFRVPFI